MLLLFALGDGCSPPPNVVGVQDFGQVAGRVLDAMTNRPIPNALLSVGSLYTDARRRNAARFVYAPCRRSNGYCPRPGLHDRRPPTRRSSKIERVSIGYIRLVPLTYPAGQADAGAAPDADATGLADGVGRAFQARAPLPVRLRRPRLGRHRDAQRGA